MNSRAGHLRILASAGSGKTFRLSARVIDLLRRVNDPSTVLASTFTRAAAAEIRDRVLRRLADAATSAKERQLLTIGSALPAPSEAEAMALLERIARDPDSLHVRTLDSFFAAAVMAFAPELGFPASLRIADVVDEERLRDDAIARMLASSAAESVVATLAALTRGHPSARVATALARAVEQVASTGRDAKDGAWRWSDHERPSQARADAVRAKLAAIEPIGSKAIDTAVAALRAALADAPATDLDRWSVVVTKGIGAKVAAGESTYNRVEIPQRIYEVYADLVEYARDLGYDEYGRRTQATGELVAAFNDAYATIKRERGFVTFEDLVFAIAAAADRPDEQELFFRLDARIRHLLLDEFQDTSAIQWRALRPIVSEIVAGDPNERSFFVVGDIKQSIYGWRGALPEILGDLPALVHENGARVEIADESIAVSYRSSQVVLDAVDAVFGSLVRNPAVPDDAAAQEAVRKWLEFYEPHVAHSKGLAGRVVLRLATKVGRSNSREQWARTMDETADLVQAIARARPGASIGVLARRNVSVSYVLNRLRELNVPASARGKGSLLDAAPVNALIDALVFADHPDHTVAAFHVAHSPLGDVVGIGRDDHRAEHAERRRQRSRELREKIERDGYAETLREWTSRISAHVDPREAERIATLVELAAEYDGADRPLRPGDVVAALRASDVDQPGSGRVSVMTIHQSKGLEFDITVLCDLDQPFRASPPLASHRSGVIGPFDRLLRWPPDWLHTADPAWAELIASARTSAYREFLSTLYVALTRAKREVVAIIAPPSLEKGTPTFNSTMGSVLRAAWAANAVAPGVAWDTGEVIAPDEPEESAPTPDAADSAAPIRLRPSTGLRALRATSASARERSRVDAIDEERHGARAVAMERGVAMHAMFACVEWIDERAPSEPELVAAAASELPYVERARLATLARDVLASMSRPELRRLLTRPAPNAEVRREWRYVRLDAEERIESGAIDRLVLAGAGGRIESATIVDFKTESLGGDDPRRRAERYRAQLDAYRNAVVERFGVRSADVSTVIAFVADDVVVKLD